MKKMPLGFLALFVAAFAETISLGDTANGTGGTSALAVPGESKMLTPLETILQKYHVPALGGAIVDSSGVKLISIAGVRKSGETVGVTIDDVWHLGSDTKAVTATMIAELVEQNKLSWDSNLAAIFPDLELTGQTGEITLLELLCHGSGKTSQVGSGQNQPL
jgi:CubicO group peptidase (beta-lactamase class C family)